MGGPGSGPRKAIVRRKRGRKTSTFLTKGLQEINNEIKSHYGKITGMDKVWKTYNKVTPSEAEACFAKYKGRCVYCDKPLSYLGTVGVYSARLSWYIPLKSGGEARPDNMVVVCASCKHDYATVPKIRQDIVGLDTFADVIERLVKAVRAGEGPEVVEPLKSRLNVRLSDIASCMRYVTTDDWVPDKFEKVIEGKNTIGEQVEKLIKGEDVKEDIVQTTKQMVTTKQYKIIRNRHDE